MNALDFLVDFAALVSTSEASGPGYDGNNVDHKVDPTHIKADSASDTRTHPPEGFSSVDGRRPANSVHSQSSMAPSLPQQTFSAHMVNHQHSATHYHVPCEESFAVYADPHMTQSFDQFLHQHPGLGLPRATPDDMSYTSCDCERLDHLALGYETNYSLPSEPPSWSHVQPRTQPSNHDGRYLETHYALPGGETSMQPSQCMDTTYHCQYLPPYHQDVSNEYTPAFATQFWGPHAPVYDKNPPKEDDEWLWVSAGGHPEMSRT